MFINKLNEILSSQILKNVDIVHIFLLINSFCSCFHKAIVRISNTSDIPLFCKLFSFLAYFPILENFLHLFLCAHFPEVIYPP